MRNTIEEMKHFVRAWNKLSPPEDSRARSITAIKFSSEPQIVQLFSWSKYVWPTADGKRFIVPLSYSEIGDIGNVICTLLRVRRFDLLEKIHFSVYSPQVIGVPTGYIDEYVDYWVGISPTKLGNNNPNRYLMSYTVASDVLVDLIRSGYLIEYLERYSTPYLKYLIKRQWNNYFLDKTEDNMELRMYLMRYVQDAPRQMEEEEPNPVEEVCLGFSDICTLGGGESV